MKLSVITVNLNGERFLPFAIASVLSQNYEDFEYILVDGGSTDGSLDVIKRAAAGDKRVRWTTGSDAGIADAMNKGVAMATGDVVSFLHSDDCYATNDVLSVVARAWAETSSAVWATGGLALINAAGVCFKELPARRYSYARLLRSNILYHPATFVSSHVLRACPFDTTLKLAMDYDLWLRLGELASPVILGRPLAQFRVHSGSRSIAAADAALVEEYHVRRRFLKSRNLWQIWLPLDCFVKRVLNRLFIKHLCAESQRAVCCS